MPTSSQIRRPDRRIRLQNQSVVTGDRAEIGIGVTQAILPARFSSADRIVCITAQRLPLSGEDQFDSRNDQHCRETNRDYADRETPAP